MSVVYPMRHVRHIHLIGIGGSGMCGIAEVLINQGYHVSGSDLQQSQSTRRLRQLGIQVFNEHAAENVQNADVVVISSAISNENVELVSAHEHLVPVINRAEMLGELMRHRYGIAVAGTHGKTTTTSLITSIFQSAGLDPTYVIGGLLKSEDRNAGLGLSKYIIAEADESDASFLYLKPMLAVITNIDQDHMSTYDHDVELLSSTFEEFITRLPFYGAVVVCIDDEGIQQIASRITRPLLTYGYNESADFRAINLDTSKQTWRYTCLRPGGLAPLDIELNLPGNQNVLNSLAAIATATDERIDDRFIVEGLANFHGVGRRFEISEVQLAGHTFTMVDDYGHHPTEISYVVETANLLWPDRKVAMVYQPHRYTRTRDLFHDFVDVLGRVDRLILLETYGAGESPIDGANVCDLAKFIREFHGKEVAICEDSTQALQTLEKNLEMNDLILVQGAGSVSEVSELLKSPMISPA